MVYLDHVTMILRFASKPNEIFFMELTAESEIIIKTWPEVKCKIGSDYNKIAYRRLKWDRPVGTREAIEKFYNEVIGTSY